MKNGKKRSSESFVRQMDYKSDFTKLDETLEFLKFYLNLAANIAGACMSDNVRNEDVVKDMHDLIGSLGAVQNAIQIIENRFLK